MAARMKAAALILLKSSIVTCMCVIAGRQKREKGKFSEGNVDVNNKTVRQSLLKLDTPPPHNRIFAGTNSTTNLATFLLILSLL